MAEIRIFYSRQSDHPNSTNRGFIEKALEKAAKEIKTQNIEIDPVIDRDTVGVPGSPDIAHTILNKIENADIVVSDVSIINESSAKRACPNPNVLIELGYALKTLGNENLIMVMNTHHGKPEKLPFDLKLRRAITYTLAPSSSEKSKELKTLTSKLVNAINAQLKLINSKSSRNLSSSYEKAVQSVINDSADKNHTVKKFTSDIIVQMEEISPQYNDDEENDETLINSLSKTIPLVEKYSLLSDTLASKKSLNDAELIYDSFTNILSRYNPSGQHSGVIQTREYDYYKFLGYELFTIFIASLIKAKAWDVIQNVLENPIYVENAKFGSGDLESFDAISEHVQLLDDRNNRLKLHRVSIHADLLNDRHSVKPLMNTVSMRDFVEADLFLFFRSFILLDEKNIFRVWRPWTAIYMGNNFPRYLIEAKRKKYAEVVLGAFGAKSIDDFIQQLENSANTLRQLFQGRAHFWDPFDDYPFHEIGSM